MRTQPAKQPSRKRDADVRSSVESIQPRARALSQPEPGGPDSAAEWVKPSALKPWPQNPTKDDPASVRRVAESIKRFGFGAPLVARRANGEVIAGHTRLRAAKQLGLELVPVRYLDISEKDAHVLALADNRLAELTLRNNAELAELLKAMEPSDQLLAGYTDDDLDKLIGAIVSDAVTLPGLDRPDPTHHQVTFVLSTRQLALVEAAMVAAKAAGAASDDNANTNGNAIAAICEAYLGQGKAD